MTVPSNLIPSRITELQADPNPSDEGWLMYVHNGVTYKVQASQILNVSGVVETRKVLAGTGLTGGGQLTEDLTLSVAPKGIGNSELSDTGVAAATYGDQTHIPVLGVNAQGRIVSATSVVSPSATTQANIDTFNGVYYGASTTNPTTRSNGTPLQNGDIYVNTSTHRMMAYANGYWYATETSGATDADLVSYTPNGTGSVATTVQTKLRESVSVKDFGAVGDGFADDFVAIQTAINATPYGSTLLLPDGVYLVSAGLVASQPIRIVGNGVMSTTIAVASSVGNTVDVLTFQGTSSGNGAEGYYISDIKIAPISGTPARHGINLGGVGLIGINRATVERVYIGQFGSFGILNCAAFFDLFSWSVSCSTCSFFDLSCSVSLCIYFSYDCN